MEDLKAEIAIVKQTQDDINGYLNSLTAEIDSLRASYDELKEYVASIESRLPTSDESQKLFEEINLIHERLDKLGV